LSLRGYTDVTVADVSPEALERARDEFPEADRITWVVADIREHHFGRRFALWHDRAVLHFMVATDDRSAYLETLRRSLDLDGHLIVATFGPEAPDRCSGLPVVRYSADSLVTTVGPVAELESWHTEDHRTPSGAIQQFLFAHFVAGPAIS
jgi:SAM-dependent methyltransferase